MKKVLTILFALTYLSTFAQFAEYDFSKEAVTKRIKKDISVLAADSIKGREAGSEGEIMARDYIKSQFIDASLSSIFENGSYFQSFTFKDGVKAGDNTSLIINGKKYKLNEDFYPLSESANGTIKGKTAFVKYGITDNINGYDDYKALDDLDGKIFVIETSVPGGSKSYSKFAKTANLGKKMSLAIKEGAAAIIFINTDKNFVDPRNKLSLRTVPVDVPVVFAKAELAKILSKKKKQDLELTVDLQKVEKTAYNVIGYLDNNAEKTIVIGAHYDHLGMGNESSRYVGPPAVHNGADDNASGTAAVMELARYFSINNPKNVNMLFIAFSAEEKGLVGSTVFAKGDDYELSKINSMINFDMIGRLDTNARKLMVNGTGTSPIWDSVLTTVNKDRFEIVQSKSGIGGSDQMPFYLSDIPVLFFFTGLHDDYHKPSDDIDKINFSGEAEIIQYVADVIKFVSGMNEIPFVKTNDGQRGRSPYNMKVSMRVIPDHVYEGKGMRLSGVIEGGPAAKAGLKKGDVILKIGEDEIGDIMSYMKALSNYSKGTKAQVLIKRGEETIKTKVQF